MNSQIRSLGMLLVAAAIPLNGAAEDYEIDWSSSFELRFDDFESPAKDDDVTGFFDQYEFTKDKDNDPAIQLGLTEFEFDVFDSEQTPLLRLRLNSPTSNVGLTGGGDTSEYFLNQRGEIDGRLPGFRSRVDYRRMRTDELRLFPNPTGVGGSMASTYTDATQPDDRFYTRRTGIGGELRFRPDDLRGGQGGYWTQLLSEVTMRGGYDTRKGKRQIRALVDFDWQGATSKLDQDVVRGGGGLVLNPVDFLTLALDVDHERFREDAASLTEGAPPAQTIGFVPDTDRTTGSARLNARLGERAVVHGGFQVSNLEQAGSITPLQSAAGLTRNKLRFYSGNAGVDVAISNNFSANAFFKYDERNNRMPRNTPLYNPGNGSQIVVFLDRVRSIEGGAELAYRIRRMNQVALGFRGEWVDRDLDFAPPSGFLGDTITPATTVVNDDTETIEGYARLALRPMAGLQVSGEVGVQGSPETGYIRALDDAVYGQARASYTFVALPKPVTLNLFTRGRSGKNHDFRQTGETLGAVDRDFDQSTLTVGGTLTTMPHKKVTLYGSAFYYKDNQDYPFVRSNEIRSLEASPFITVDFFEDQPMDYRSDLTVLAAGGRVRFSEKTDSAATYSFTRSNVRFLSNGMTGTTIQENSRIRSDVHRLEVELGHWITDGLRVSTGYRWQKYRDRSLVGGAGVVAPFNLSTEQHTVVLGITLNSDLIR